MYYYQVVMVDKFGRSSAHFPQTTCESGFYARGLSPDYASIIRFILFFLCLQVLNFVNFTWKKFRLSLAIIFGILCSLVAIVVVVRNNFKEKVFSLKGASMANLKTRLTTFFHKTIKIAETDTQEMKELQSTDNSSIGAVSSTSLNEEIFAEMPIGEPKYQLRKERFSDFIL